MESADRGPASTPPPDEPVTPAGVFLPARGSEPPMSAHSPHRSWLLKPQDRGAPAWPAAQTDARQNPGSRRPEGQLSSWRSYPHLHKAVVELDVPRIGVRQGGAVPAHIIEHLRVPELPGEQGQIARQHHFSD